MKIIVGLGNPGVEYLLTRHNAGVNFVDYLGVRELGTSPYGWRREKNKIVFKTPDFILIKTASVFMNESGRLLQGLSLSNTSPSNPSPNLGAGGQGVKDLLVGGGVAANMKLREEIKKLSDEVGLNIHYPPNLMLCTDNAAMIGVAAGFKAKRGEFTDPERIDRLPRWRGDEISS